MTDFRNAQADRVEPVDVQQIISWKQGHPGSGGEVLLLDLSDRVQFAVDKNGGVFATPDDGTTAPTRVLVAGADITVHDLHATGNAVVDGSVTAGVVVTAPQLVSTVATGTPPLAVTSITKVANFNADLLDNQDGSWYQARANHTGTQAPSTISPQGAGSTLDADLLDGQHGTFYLARANHTGTQAAATISPQGAGSALDADLLDGQHGAYYLDTSATAQTKAGALNVSGDFAVAGTALKAFAASNKAVCNIASAQTRTSPISSTFDFNAGTNGIYSDGPVWTNGAQYLGSAVYWNDNNTGALAFASPSTGYLVVRARDGGGTWTSYKVPYFT